MSAAKYNNKNPQALGQRKKTSICYVRRYKTVFKKKKSCISSLSTHTEKHEQGQVPTGPNRTKTQCYIAIILPVDKASKAETEHLKQQQN